MQKKTSRTFRWNTRDILLLFGWTAVKTAGISYLFYDSAKAVLLGVPIGLLEYRKRKHKGEQERKRQLTMQFRSLVEAIATSLAAGYSLEHAFADAQRDLLLVYPEKAEIFTSCRMIQNGLDRNVPIERLFAEFGRKSKIEDIENFANVMRAAKHSGGNLIRIIQKTVRHISDKIAVEEEIQTMIAAKKLEEQIMLVMPYGILLYLRVCSGDFLAILYHNGIGVCLMTAFLTGIYLAGIWADQIMEIRV